MSQTCNLKVSSCHIKKKQNATSEINRNSIFCVAQYLKNIIISPRNHIKIINEIPETTQELDMHDTIQYNTMQYNAIQ